MSKIPNISFRDVSFSIDSEQVLDHFSFMADPHKHTVIKGESGSGKSTILTLLLGFNKPDSGTISLGNSDWNTQTLRRHTAWLPQDLNMGDGQVREVIANPFKFAANQSAQKNLRQQTSILQQLGLGPETLDKQFRDLSTGQRQRVGLAICHMLDKPLLLLDEPTSALDHRSKQKAAELLLTPDRTVISTSHDSFWVNKADNVIELN